MHPQARDARISELEAQEKALTEARERLSRSQDALTDDAFHAQDLLRAAAHRMRRSRAERGAVAPRRSGGGVVHMMSPLVGDDAASVRIENLDGVGDADAHAGGAPAFGRHDEGVDRGNGNSNSDGDRTRVPGVPAYSRPPSLAFSVDDASAAWGAGRVPPGLRRPYGGDGGGGGGTRGSSRLSASVPAPVWSGGRLGTSSLRVRGGLPARGRGPQDDDDEEEEEQEEEGVEPEGAAAAAMEVLREVERMHVGGSNLLSRR